MNKEIYINGINVSGCYFLNKGITNLLCTCPSEIDEECKYNPNCYFKQLKLKEQECEELKEKKHILKEGYIKKLKKWYRYKQALDEIKSICNKTCGVCQIFRKCNKEYSTCKNARIIDIINKAKDGE